MKEISVYLLTGFLGAGKTTALNELLKQFKDEVNVVIENEFGKIGIDASLVNKTYSDMYELSNGCICCNLDNDLYDVLFQIERNEKRPDNLFIETTGIADAGNVAAIFARYDIQQVFILKKVICMVDAENIEELLKEVPETTRQIVSADLIVLNKIECLSNTYLEEVKELLYSLNPFAKMITSKMGFIPISELQKDYEHIQNLNVQPIEIPKRINEHRIVSVSFATNEIYDIDELHHALTVTLLLHYKQVYRIKGIIKIATSNDKILLQSTGKALNLSPIGEWGEDEVCESKIVAIGLGLKTPFLERICKNAFAQTWQVDGLRRGIIRSTITDILNQTTAVWK